MGNRERLAFRSAARPHVLAAQPAPARYPLARGDEHAPDEADALIGLAREMASARADLLAESLRERCARTKGTPGTLRMIYAGSRRLAGMKRALVALALCACVAVPLVAQGQPSGPSPDQRAMMDKMRADSKTATYAALTPAHAAAVTGIVAQVVAGSVDGHAAAKQIDALLTPDEQKVVMAAAEKSRSAMRAMMGPGGPPPGPGGPPPGDGPPPMGPGGPPPGGGPPPPGGRRFGAPSAGGYLLMISLSRRQMRSLIRGRGVPPRRSRRHAALSRGPQTRPRV